MYVRSESKEYAMTMVRCEITEGPREGYKTVGVPSAAGHMEYLAIEERFLVKDNGAYLLPVDVVGKDPRYGTLLVQLPFEADSGANRVWVRPVHIVKEPREVPA
jgi:hypothetical protein